VRDRAELRKHWVEPCLQGVSWLAGVSQRARKTEGKRDRLEGSLVSVPEADGGVYKLVCEHIGDFERLGLIRSNENLEALVAAGAFIPAFADCLPTHAGGREAYRDAKRRERIAELLWTGGSLIVSDNPRSYEMSDNETDFIVLTR